MKEKPMFVSLGVMAAVAVGTKNIQFGKFCR